MRSCWSTLILANLIHISAALASGGDDIRSSAPVTALMLDARSGNADALKQAYFRDEIDYFLDIEAPTSSIARELLNLRQVGSLIESGDFASAEQRLRQVRGFDDERIYLEGVLLAAKGQYQPAIENFRQLIDRRHDLSKRLASLAFMGAARVFHEVADYKSAIYHYTQVRQLEPEFFEAVFEKSWSFYLDGDMNGALGATLSFLSPYFDSAFFPEAYVLRAAAFFQLCYYDRANLAVEKFRKDFAPIKSQIAELIKRGPQGWLFDERVLKAVNPRLMGFFVSDHGFRSALRAFLALKEELKTSRNPALTNRALNFVKGQLANHSRRMLEKADNVLKKNLAQADLIQIEILQTGANVLLGAAAEHNIPVKTIDLGSVDFDALVQFWNFKGEFWVDELGSYYYGLKSNCGS